MLFIYIRHECMMRSIRYTCCTLDPLLSTLVARQPFSQVHFTHDTLRGRKLIQTLNRATVRAYPDLKICAMLCSLLNFSNASETSGNRKE